MTLKVSYSIWRSLAMGLYIIIMSIISAVSAVAEAEAASGPAVMMAAPAIADRPLIVIVEEEEDGSV